MQYVMMPGSRATQNASLPLLAVGLLLLGMAPVSAFGAARQPAAARQVGAATH
jgi:hypothetical protein